MSLMELNQSDDLDKLAKEWNECQDFSRREEIVKSHYRVRNKLGSSPADRKREKIYLDFSSKLRTIGEPIGRRRYHDMYWDIKSSEDGKAVGKFFKFVAVVLGILIAAYVIADIAFSPKIPENVLRQMRPFDPLDDPRSDTGGYRTRGL